jgi:hypothetical protein
MKISRQIPASETISKYSNTMKPTTQLLEDDLSSNFAQILSNSSQALKLFFEHIKVTLPKASKLPLKIESQYSLPNSRRIDIAIHRRDFAVLIECKINDPQKSYGSSTFSVGQ